MSTTDPLPPVCPRCGTSLKNDAPEGLCPRCLAAVNFETGSLFTGTGTSLPPPPIEEIAPHFPQLEILSCLGRGGMGVVYKARQISLDRLVALKLLAPEREMDPEFADRFAREAQALARMSHPHIVTVHDFGQAGGFFYLLMEYVDGANLRQLLQSHKFTPEQALAVVPPLCDALQYAHERGIVHRDIKPENLLMDREGKLKVADFGLVKMLGNQAAGDERPVGTPSYMAPEQSADPVKVDNRADIYSLGVVIYEMLTGELPGKNFQPPSNKASIDSRLDDVVMRAMEQDPDQRYQQASMLKTEVENITRTGTQVPASEPTPPAIPAPVPVPDAIVQPALAMLVTSVLALASQLFGLLAGLVILVFPMGFLTNFPLPIPNNWVGGGMSLVALLIGFWLLISTGLNVVAAYGALKMRRLQSYPWAIASAIILIVAGLMSLPTVAFSMGGLLSLAQLATGIWGLVILQREEVKAAFRATPPPTTAAAIATPPTVSNEEAARKASIPAIGLMVTAGLNLLAIPLVLVVGGLGVVNRNGVAWTPIFVILFLMFFGIALCSVIFAGGWQMRKLRSHTLAVIAAILAILTPPGFLIGAIFGIWALVVLFDRQAKAAFQSGKTNGFATACLIAGAAILALLLVPTLLIGALRPRQSSFSISSGAPFSSSSSFTTGPIGMPPLPDMPSFPQMPTFPAAPAPATLPVVDAETGPATDLAARLDASRMISDFQKRDKAYAQIATDAAAAGNAPISKLSVQAISDFILRDDSRKTIAIALSDHGLRKEAVEIARQISDFTKRDATLVELSSRKAPAEQGPER